ncbi:hypothetical protein MNBD_CPR01-566 [hydrothermal vent metagenome]|uniref:Uncharacterized protein n=1 Tax=hydrothermal vent metagenome TaxID=652676 RepID=A0A3B0UQD4_9ZZZZ
MLPTPGYTSLNVEYVFRALYEAATNVHLSTGALHPIITATWQIITVVGYLASAGALFVIVYSIMHIEEVRRKEKEKYGPLPKISEDTPHENPRWKQVEELISGENVNDWRQAIIEADIILGEVLTRQGYKGETIGEQLKQIERADFDSLDNAWEAHKVRNMIAHSGSAFALSETLARRTISHYKKVFHEFEVI